MCVCLGVSVELVEGHRAEACSNAGQICCVTKQWKTVQRGNVIVRIKTCLSTQAIYVTVVTTKRKQLDRKPWNLYWIIGRKSQLSLENKLLVYKVILKPVWTYGIQLWGTASNSNLEILERFQSKVLRIITDAPWYVPNAMIKRDLQVPTVR